MFESWAAYEALARDRQRDILARAELDRIMAGLERSRDVSARLRWRLRTWLGKGLVALGTRMQEADPNHDGDLRQAS